MVDIVMGVMVLCGAFFMLAAILTMQKIRHHIPEALVGRWRHMTLLMQFFFAGYILFCIILASRFSIPTELVTGPVFFGGAVFVFIVTKLTQESIMRIRQTEEYLREADSELRKVKNYLLNIINSMPSMLAGMDLDGTVTQWNQGAEHATGISAGEAVGKPIESVLPDFSPWIKDLHSDMTKRRPSVIEKLLLEKNGARRFYNLMLYPLIANGMEGAVVRIEDVTERTRIEELMIQTEKMMSVGGVAAGMAHEINNPLGIIAQAAQNIERRVSLELEANRNAADEIGVEIELVRAYFEKRRIPEFIRSIREAAARAAKIVSDTLQFSRQSSGKNGAVSLATLMDQAVEMASRDYDLKKKYDFRNIEIVREYRPDMPEVPVVRVEIEQVILNLLRNASQAIISNPPEKKPRITLRLRCEERYAVMEVEDNGPGMAEGIRRRVFEPFFTTKEPGVGTGLGLSVSYMIVTDNHKGLMSVESSPGNGAHFIIRLPLKQGA